MSKLTAEKFYITNQPFMDATKIGLPEVTMVRCIELMESYHEAKMKEWDKIGVWQEVEANTETPVSNKKMFDQSLIDNALSKRNNPLSLPPYNPSHATDIWQLSFADLIALKNHLADKSHAFPSLNDEAQQKQRKALLDYYLTVCCELKARTKEITGLEVNL